MSRSLPPLPESFSYRLDLAPAATPRLLKHSVVHRWFYFPHSYSPELVEAILDEWALPPGASVVDPFVGAGTTLLVAQAKGYNAVGFDLSPLSVLVSNAKAAHHDLRLIQAALAEIMGQAASIKEETADCSPRLARALTRAEYSVFFRLRQAISRIDIPTQGLLIMGLIAILPRFSRAVADGGWFRWAERPDQAALIIPSFQDRIQSMLAEVPESDENESGNSHAVHTEAFCQDARQMHLQPASLTRLLHHLRIPTGMTTAGYFR